MHLDRDDDDEGPDLAYRTVVRRLVGGDLPRGQQYDACRAVLRGDQPAETVFGALCMLLEGALADPALAIDDTQVVVRLLKGLAQGTIFPDEVM